MKGDVLADYMRKDPVTKAINRHKKKEEKK